MSFNKIFCIGLSRTGTTSLCEAIKLLDIPTIHYPIQLFVQPEVISKDLHFEPKIKKRKGYRKIVYKNELSLFKNQSQDAERILKNNVCFGDLPIPLFYKYLDEKFPGSKFIYTYREEKKWLESIKWLFNKGPILWDQGEIDLEIRFQTYGTRKYDRDKLLNAYNTYHQDVLNYFKARERDLLMINIDQHRIKFSDLCSFLDLENPQIEFPKSNQAREPMLNQYITYYLKKNVPYFQSFVNKVKNL